MNSMGTIVNRFEDLGDVKELYHHNIRNVEAYLTACGFERSKYVNYKFVRVFVDYKNKRAVEVYIEDMDDRCDIVERIEFLEDVEGV